MDSDGIVGRPARTDRLAVAAPLKSLRLRRSQPRAGAMPVAGRTKPSKDHGPGSRATRRPAKLPPRPARPAAARPPPQRGKRRPACPDQATPRTPDVAAGHGERRPVSLRLPVAGAHPTAPDVRTGPAGRKGGRGRRRHRDGERLPAMPDLSSPARWCREAAAGTGRVRRRRLSPTRRRETRPRRKADGLCTCRPLRKDGARQVLTERFEAGVPSSRVAAHPMLLPIGYIDTNRSAP